MVVVLGCSVLLAGCARSGEGDQQATTRLVVTFREWPDLTTSATDWSGQGAELVQRLRSVSDASQSPVRRAAGVDSADWRSYWVANAAVVTGPESLADRLAGDPAVLRVTRLSEQPTARDETLDPVDGVSLRDPGPNLTAVAAPDAWAAGRRGGGMVVGVIDTGVDGTHPALRGAQRAERSWFDAVGGCGSTPCDRVGHGTMAAGLAVGDPVPGAGPAIGVAPDAEWIAARACDDDSCGLDALLAAGQWMTAPGDTDVDADPAARPHVVNNSWGLTGDEPVLDRMVQVWRAAGIVAVFAAGNTGPACRTVLDPGVRPEVVSVGAVNDLGRALDLSARGGSGTSPGSPEPDLVAPGESVASSTTGGGYARGDGTSFAAPQVAGGAAVLRAALADPLGPGSVDQVAADLRRTARPLQLDEPCGPGTVGGAGMLDLTPR